MKRLLAVGLLALVLAFASVPAFASQDGYNDMDSHPLRVAAYLVYPIGFTAEWLIFRPFHYIISQPYLDEFFGYKPQREMPGY